MDKPVLFFDFDNTITQGDLLDAILERFSKDSSWLELEDAWRNGKISTFECLRRQVGNLKPSRTEILDFATTISVDPYFVPIVDWAARSHVDLIVISDNFTALIDVIFKHHNIPNVPVFANELKFFADHVEAEFPYQDPSCSRCAHCKARQIRKFPGQRKIFVGDGLSDICPANIADIVFAKDSLARYLAQSNKKFLPFHSLQTVLDFLVEQHS
ncbi:MAG TPA: MtnX-like HAD-IB family phosphatase [Burkholderiales bacterium]